MSNVYGLAYNFVGFRPMRGVLPFWKCKVTDEIYYNRIWRYIGKHFLDDAPMWPEVELAVMVGGRGDEELYVKGVAVANDVTRGKDTHSIMGKSGYSMCKIKNEWYAYNPYRYEKSRIAMAINNKRVQDNNLFNLKLQPDAAIRWLGEIIDLQDDDIILMGTPPHDKPEIHPGDTVSCWIEGIGELVNHVV